MILKHSHTFFAFVPHGWASGNPRIDIHPQILFKVSKKKLPVSNFFVIKGSSVALKISLNLLLPTTQSFLNYIFN